MNHYTKKEQFMESADYILNNSDLLIKGDCVIHNDVLYEKLEDDTFRFFFSIDDYDYLEYQELTKEFLKKY